MSHWTLRYTINGKHLDTAIDDYVKDSGPGEVRLLCSFYHEPLRTWIETNVNTFAISNHTALKLDIQALRRYLSLICEYELYVLPDKKLVPQRIMVKTTWRTDHPWSAIFSVIVYGCIFSLATWEVLRHAAPFLLHSSSIGESTMWSFWHSMANNWSIMAAREQMEQVKLEEFNVNGMKSTED